MFVTPTNDDIKKSLLLCDDFAFMRFFRCLYLDIFLCHNLNVSALCGLKMSELQLYNFRLFKLLLFSAVIISSSSFAFSSFIGYVRLFQAVSYSGLLSIQLQYCVVSLNLCFYSSRSPASHSPFLLLNKHRDIKSFATANEQSESKWKMS